MVKFVILNGKKYPFEDIFSWVVELNDLKINKNFQFSKPFEKAVREILPKAPLTPNEFLKDETFILHLEDYFLNVKFSLNDQAEFCFGFFVEDPVMHSFLTDFQKEVSKDVEEHIPMNWLQAYQIISRIADGEYSPIEDIKIKRFGGY